MYGPAGLVCPADQDADRLADVTLPPVMEEEFIEQNKLVRPRIIRESTNRPNTKYMVSLEAGPSMLVERAADLVRAYWPKKEIFDYSQDKIIIYCRTREGVVQLADILDCPTYTSRSGTDEEKDAIISGWLGNRDQPVITATSALGIGLDSKTYIRE
jgi:superfamily II DNA helicase RecQ